MGRKTKKCDCKLSMMNKNICLNCGGVASWKCVQCFKVFSKNTKKHKCKPLASDENENNRETENENNLEIENIDEDFENNFENLNNLEIENINEDFENNFENLNLKNSDTDDIESIIFSENSAQTVYSEIFDEFDGELNTNLFVKKKLIDDDETYEPVSENNDDYDDDINFEENSNSSCDEKEDISKVLKANQKYFQNGLKMNFKEKEFEDAFEDIPDSYFKKNIMDLSTEVSIDFDSIEIFCKNPKYININKGIVDLGLYCTDLKKKGIIYLGTLNGIAIILKFPTSYDTFLVFNDYLESIFELNNISLPRSQDDINFNYKIKRIRINNEIFNDIISRFFKKLKNENHYEKKGNIERIHFIDEEKKGNIKIYLKVMV
jgi:hypothetical protein